MQKMRSKEIHTTKKGGEYLTELLRGDVFFSFHGKTDCAGIFIKKSEINKENLEIIWKELIQLFPDCRKMEAKIIATAEVIEMVSLFLNTKGCLHLKKVEKTGFIEVAFLPLVNRVRIAVDHPQVAEKKNPVITEFKSKKKILIVDDSKTIRNILQRIFTSDPLFEVCAMAERPSEVEALIEKHRPDLITLDIHMPEMDGVQLLKIIAPKYKIPTIMISSISMAEGPLVLEALENGAIDYIQKPEMSELGKVTPMILEKATTAVMVKASRKDRDAKARFKLTEKGNLESLIVLGSSTGGTEAIRDILTALPDQIPPMLIVQHIPAVFSAAFAKRMNDLCHFDVKEAANGDEVLKNRVLIAPGGMQMKMVHKKGRTFVEINDDEPVNRFKPSVDYLFFSVAKNLYTNTVAVILTGMGKDGAKGMFELHKLGVHTIAQDEATSVVFGMPKEAIALGGAQHIEPLQDIAQKLIYLTHQNTNKTRGIA